MDAVEGDWLCECSEAEGFRVNRSGAVVPFGKAVLIVGRFVLSPATVIPRGRTVGTSFRAGSIPGLGNGAADIFLCLGKTVEHDDSDSACSLSWMPGDSSSSGTLLVDASVRINVSLRLRFSPVAAFDGHLHCNQKLENRQLSKNLRTLTRLGLFEAAENTRHRATSANWTTTIRMTFG